MCPNKAFPWLTARRCSVGAAGLIAMRVNFVGELGYELHHPIEMQNTIFDALMEAGAPFGIKPFGIRAMDSLRLEKSYKLVGRELSIEYAALESGLDRFVDLGKGPFLGRDALVAWRDKGFANRLVTLEVLGVTDADARGSEPVMKGGAIVGRTTSGGYGWRVGKSLALAMVRPEFATCRRRGRRAHPRRDRRAVVIADSPYDPQNKALEGKDERGCAPFSRWEKGEAPAPSGRAWTPHRLQRRLDMPPGLRFLLFLPPLAFGGALGRFRRWRAGHAPP